MRQIQLEFLLLQFRAPSPTGASHLLALITEVAADFGAEVEQLLGTLILIHNGAQGAQSKFDREALVKRFQDELPGDLRIIHGHAPGTCGNLGGDGRLFYGATFLGSDYAIARIFELPPGSVENLTS